MAKAQVSNRKFYVVLGVTCLAFLLLLGTVIGIWAATSQTVKAGFNVTYTVGENVAAKVRTEYYVPNQDTDEDGEEDGPQVVVKNEQDEVVENENGFIVFNAGDDLSTKSVYIGNFELTPTTPSIIFYFTVENLLVEEGFIETSIIPSYTLENIDVNTYYYNSTSFDTSLSANEIDDADFVNTEFDNIAPEGCKVIKIVASVIDGNSSASFAGSFTINFIYSSNAVKVSE